MNLYIEGYRSHNKTLTTLLTDAAYYYVYTLLGGRMACLLYTSPSPRDRTRSRMPSSA